MVYRIDNRRKKNHGRYTLLGIVLGIVLTVGGFYVYDNYKQIIIDNVNDIIKENTPKNVIVVQHPVIIKSFETNPKVIARQIHDLVNQERIKNEISVLVWDENIAQIEQQHSNEMTANGEFDHAGINNRLSQMGCPEGSENIAWQQGFNFEQFSNRMVNDWMDSPIHRDNILNSSFSREGIDVAISGYYITVTEGFC